jgi:putative NADH-flavin reductase
MKVAIIGTSDKTGIKLVQQSLERGYQEVTVCRHSSIEKLQKFTNCGGFTLMSVPVMSAKEALTKALDGCEAVLAVLITAGRLKATELVMSQTKATAMWVTYRMVRQI